MISYKPLVGVSPSLHHMCSYDKDRLQSQLHDTLHIRNSSNSSSRSSSSTLHCIGVIYSGL